MNLATFRSRISGAIGLDNTASSTEQGLIDGWVNEAVEQFLIEVKPHWRTAQLATTAGSGDYTLDTDILAFKDIYLAPGDSSINRQLQQVDTEEIIRNRILLSASTGVSPYKYAVQGSNILMLFPVPQSGDVLHILYIPRPTALSATADSPSATANGGIPAEFHPILEAYAKWKGADYADDKSSQYGQLYLQEWARGLAKAKEIQMKKAGVRTGSAKIGKTRRWPVGSGVDDGA